MLNADQTIHKDENLEQKKNNQGSTCWHEFNPLSLPVKLH